MLFWNTVLTTGQTKLHDDYVTRFESNSPLKDVVKSIAQSASITAKMMAEVDQPLYFPLPSEFIIPGWQTLVELYIKRNDTYEVAFHENEIIFAEQLEDLQRLEDFKLFVNRDKRLKFVNNLTLQYPPS